MWGRLTSGFLTLVLSVGILLVTPFDASQRFASATESTNTVDAPILKITGHDQVGPYPVGIKSAIFRDWAQWLNPPLGYSGRYTTLYVCDLNQGDYASPWDYTRYGARWCIDEIVQPDGGFDDGYDTNQKYTSKHKEDTLKRIREAIKPTDSTVHAYKIFLEQNYNLAGQSYKGISEPVTIFNQSPRVVGRDLDTTVSANLWQARIDLGESINFDMYECSKYSSKPQLRVPSGCSSFSEDSINYWGAILDDREYLGKYFALRVTGSDGTFQYFSKTTGAIRKSPLAIGLVPTNGDDAESTSLSAPVGTTYKLTLSTGLATSLNDPHIGNYKCPNNALITIKNLATGYLLRKTIRLTSSSSGDPVDCTGQIPVPIQANMRVQVELPGSYWTSKSTKTLTVKGEPALTASAPKRAFDSYTLRLKANRPLTTTCNVREEYFSFGGYLIATKWFSVSMRYGYATKKRFTYYVGVIKAMVTCKSTSKYGVAIDTYKVFSY